MNRRVNGGVLLITALDVADAHETLVRAERVFEAVGDPAAGERILFGVRDHGAPVRGRLELARALIAIARPRGARVVVHDRVDVALAAGADGVQLAERSIGVAEARALLGRGAWIGRSCHDAAGLESALREGADAVTLSPLFASPGKGEPLGVERFAALRSTTPDLAVFALGGVDAGNAALAARAGASGAATIRGWLCVPDPALAVRAILEAFR